MKFSATQALMGALPMAAAFPAQMLEIMQSNPELAARSNELLAARQAGAGAATAIFETIPTFDKEAQYIDVSAGSGHEWQPPRKGDLRGVCPGLNAFANHGFLPRNGYATIQQYIDITEKVVGMGADLSGFLAVLGALLDGDLTAWSMGGTPPLGVGGPLAQGGHGLIGSHNKYENDVSPTRPDLYESGNNYITDAAAFQKLIDVSPGGEVTLDSLTVHRSNRFDRSLNNNPYFFNGPFPGLLVQSAAFTFIYRFMANHSEADPVGTLSYDVIKSWFGIEGENGNYKARQGYERIPENWYRRSLTAPYTIPYFLGDTVVAAGLHPKFLNVGGNLDGKTNNFAGVNINNLTGGVFNGADLLKGNNLGCFAFQTVTQLKGDLLAGVVSGIQNLLGSLIPQLGCPKLNRIDEQQLRRFPGYVRGSATGVTN
ncbi:unnamed protein product [Zymoseptoria tritici ST99CH_3D1]|uniref:Heme haloperoxidase family profile domain-containing protein n=2 Tax=Zymoseptoria tritici TaxID=1047171 RepID=F9XN56_ZYMTI|nr:uncharacterized protein MYCGRDRAFT_96677 [Zymoseptoria tritici IPO323]EGP83573.1 hypothetical protein MYCGRDRAFT_96677 [Zymoseptoria tritici IPO323]SMQ55276.1 unnamed protein product [Zymoseptoria tritici ST99CH_3D7]SMR63599.1 unnamed protein product [Zymoseptoria tritici ST99CH_3D1]